MKGFLLNYDCLAGRTVKVLIRPSHVKTRMTALSMSRCRYRRAAEKSVCLTYSRLDPFVKIGEIQR